MAPAAGAVLEAERPSGAHFGAGSSPGSVAGLEVPRAAAAAAGAAGWPGATQIGRAHV